MMERRRLRRFVFKDPPAGYFSKQGVLLSDLSLRGASLVHAVAIKVGGTGLLQFGLNGRPVAVVATVVSCRLEGRATSRRFRTGVRFELNDETTSAALRALLTDLVSDELSRMRESRRGRALAESA